VLINRHYTYNCLKLMHNKEVFYTNFSFSFIFTTRQAKYHHLWNQSCSKRAISVTYSKPCVWNLRFPTYNARLHTVIRDLSGSTIFFHIIS
jgi:hypothetical protein